MNKVLRGMGVLAVMLAVVVGSAWGAPPAKVLILPPVLHGSSDMAFLQQGVVDMLTTRLAKPGKVSVLPAQEGMAKAAPGQSEALTLGRQRGADYVIFGSLTLLGGGVSTDLRMMALADDALALSFSRSGSDQAALIDHMDQFAAQANQKVLGLSVAPAVAPLPAPSAGQAPERDSIYQHPEKILERPMASEQGLAGGAASGSGFFMAGNRGMARGPRIKAQVQGLAIGDLTGDGQQESVYIGRHSVWVYRYVNGRFAKMAHIKGTGNYVGVDTADLDGDGRDEIFVTNVDDSDGQVISFVLAYNGRTFDRRAEKLSLYFRAINLPQRGRVLLGQRAGIDTFFVSGIFEIGFKDGAYRKETRWKAPREVNLYGLGKGTFMAGDSGQLMAFSKSRYLEMLSPGGKVLWRSGEHFGGSVALLQKKAENEDLAETLRYMPARIEVLDLDDDGVDEVVVMRNQEFSGSVLARSRVLKSGRMEVLKADVAGLSPYWRTRYLSKYISDFALADMDGDGRVEIVAALVQKTGSSLSTGQSQIYVFRLGAATEAATESP